MIQKWHCIHFQCIVSINRQPPKHLGYGLNRIVTACSLVLSIPVCRTKLHLCTGIGTSVLQKHWHFGDGVPVQLQNSICFFFFVHNNKHQCICHRAMIFFSFGIFVSAFVGSDKEIRLNRMGKFPGLFMQLDRDGFFLKFFPDTLRFIFCGCLLDTHVVPIHPTDDKIYSNDYKYGNDNFYNCTHGFLFFAHCSTSLVRRSVFWRNASPNLFASTMRPSARFGCRVSML